jgi:hypothetical protein
MSITPYCTVEQGEAYAMTSFKHEVWDNATDDDKLRALLDASDLIDNLNYSGVACSTNTANRQFPREGASIPDKIIKACYELAYALLDGADPELEMESAYQAARTFDTINITRSVIHPRLTHGIVSMKAWILLRPFLRDPNALTLTRV